MDERWMRETRRLFLTLLTRDDAESFHRIIGRDEIGRNLPKGEGYSLDEARNWIDGISRHWSRRGYGIWGIVEKVSSDLIGYVGLQYCEEMENVELLYSIVPERWGRGYATESGLEAIRYGREERNLGTIIGLTKLRNDASARVLEKCGMTFKAVTECFGIKCKYFESA